MTWRIVRATSPSLAWPPSSEARAAFTAPVVEVVGEDGLDHLPQAAYLALDLRDLGRAP